MVEVLVLLVPILVIVAIAAAAWRRSQVVTVNDQTRQHADQAQVERHAFGALGTIPKAALTQAVPGQMTLVSKWTPTWAVVVGILAFPVGLLLLLLIRQELTLHVRFNQEADGSTHVHVSGKTLKRVAEAVGRALSEQPHVRA